MKNYDRVLDALKARLKIKHSMYGDSYKDKPYFMFLRTREEMEELEKELLIGTSNVLHEALDVAICALLIADIWLDLMERKT